ncbi:hypothetical protein SAMN06265173_1323 [Thalassovita litoralis]|uniref:Uncharacterized protein n=1 Tax=Thalassovita litoralis TaxID=1010611 RepID=A0A521FL32_9RHOB|nr:hypothetical protein SAMN06265173_1323 [Thalassovita litoralis]
MRGRTPREGRFERANITSKSTKQLLSDVLTQAMNGKKTGPTFWPWFRAVRSCPNLVAKCRPFAITCC